MFNVVLYQPEIPPNTGNIMRLCANTGVALHLVHPLGFSLDQRQLRRAGLDYRDLATVREHTSLAAALQSLNPAPPSVWAFSTRGGPSHAAVRYRPGDVLLFGPETRGLPDEVLEAQPSSARLRIPMQPGSRSLNLSNAVAVVVYEAWRQHDFAAG